MIDDTFEVGIDEDWKDLVEPSKTAPKKDDRLEALQRDRDARAAEVEAERQKRLEAERVASERGHDLSRMTVGFGNAHLGKIASDIDKVKTEGDAAERDYAKAMETGDYNLAAKAQRLISAAEAKRESLEREKAEMERWIERNASAPPESAKKEEPAQREQDPLASVPKLTREWLDEHKEYMTDRKLHAKLQAAAIKAEHVEDIKPHTREFFDFIEKELGLASGDADMDAQEEEEREPARAEERARSRTVAAAPVSRGGSSGGAGGGFGKLPPDLAKVARDIGWNGRLPARLVEKAREIGSSNENYTIGVLKGIRDGKMPRDFLKPDYKPSNY